MSDESDITLGEEICAWIEEHCRCPEGALCGQPLVLMEWQKNFIRKVYDNPRNTRRAILSVPRKSGKTCLAACLLLVHLAGPMAIPNSQTYSTALSRDQASLLFGLASKIVRMSPRLSAVIVIKDGIKQLLNPANGASYRALSSEASVAYGLSPVFVVHDELGQNSGPRSELFEALETAGAAQLAPLSVVISTQARSDQDLLSVLIDDALNGYDERVVCVLYAAPVDCDPFSLEAIRAANPAFGVYQNPEETMSAAQDAKRMPSRQASYKNLILNQRVEASAPFITEAQWNACAGEPLNIVGREVYGGLDLSATADLTALVLIHQDVRDGIWHIAPTFWLPAEGLAAKSQGDRIPYDQWRDEGYLQTSPGAVVSYEHVAYRLKQVFAQHNVVRVGFDRWNMQFLRPWLLAAGLSEQLIEEKFTPVGMGFKTMSPALRDLEALILEKKLRHGNHPILRMCMSNCVVETDPAANRKLNKRRSRGRIDGAVALLMAIGVVPMKTPVTFDPMALIA